MLRSDQGSRVGWASGQGARAGAGAGTAGSRAGSPPGSNQNSDGSVSEPVHVPDIRRISRIRELGQQPLQQDVPHPAVAVHVIAHAILHRDGAQERSKAVQTHLFEAKETAHPMHILWRLEWGGSKTGVSQDAHKKRASEKKQTWGQKQVWHKWSQERCILCGPEGNVSMARRLASHCFSGRSQSQHFSPSKKLLFSIAFPSPVRYASVPTNTPGVPQICLHSNDHLEWSQGHFTCVLYITTHKQLANWQIHKPRACMHTYIPFVQVNTSQQNKVILLVCCTLQHTSNLQTGRYTNQGHK